MRQIYQMIWRHRTLFPVVALATFLDFYALTRSGYGNLYYAAAVRSMSANWQNFFFVSLDPGGFVTVDKPPLGLWVQSASVKLLGFSGVNLILPQAIAGVACVVLLYYLVEHTFGRLAGWAAALMLALTPISVAANRDNTLDTLVELTALLAAWAVMRAVETRHSRCLIAGAVLIGLGFNIKTLDIMVVVPTFVLLYLLAGPGRPRARLQVLALAGTILVVIALAWVVAVCLTPASQRPFVGSSGSNSELSLTFGYNGLARVAGASRGNSGPPSPLRLLDQQLGGQIAWLLPLALLGQGASIWLLPIRKVIDKTRHRMRAIRRRKEGWRQALLAGLRALMRFRPDHMQQGSLLWGVWFWIAMITYSEAVVLQTYYLVLLAPALCAMAAVGLVGMWRDWLQKRGWQSYLLLIALFVTALVQAYIVHGYIAWRWWLVPVILLLAIAAAPTIQTKPIGSANPPPSVSMGPSTQPDKAMKPLRCDFNCKLVLLLGLAAVLVGPLTWSFNSLSGADAGGFPRGGPGTHAQPVTSMLNAPDPKLVAYLQQHRGSARFLAGVLKSDDSEPLIIVTGQPVMTMGGYAGGDRIITPSRLAHMVAQGTVRYFYINPSARVPQINQDLQQWIVEYCSPVPAEQWQTHPGFGSQGGHVLYACDPLPS